MICFSFVDRATAFAGSGPTGSKATGSEETGSKARSVLVTELQARQEDTTPAQTDLTTDGMNIQCAFLLQSLKFS